MSIEKGMQEKGFTLVEISIVLVIVGLIVGGIMVGSALIEASRNRSDVSTINKFFSAVNTFRLKYNAMPGDMSNSAEVGLGPSCVTDKMNNWLIGDENTADTGFHLWTRESYAAVNQLAFSNLIGGFLANNITICSGALAPATNIPALENLVGFLPLSHHNQNYIRTGISPSFFSNVSVESRDTYTTPAQANYLSLKLADGTPGILNGSFYATGSSIGGVPNNNLNIQPTFSTAGGSGCVIGTSPLAAGQTFNVRNTRAACNLFIAIK